MKPGGALVAKIIDIDRQHTPKARLCSPRAIRTRKEWGLVSWTQTMHKDYSLLSLHTLDSRWLTSSLSSIDPQNLSPRINASLYSWSLESFRLLKIRQTLECSIHSGTHGVWPSLGKTFLLYIYGNRGMCSSFPFILQVQTMCLQVAMQFKYFDHVHV